MCPSKTPSALSTYIMRDGWRIGAVGVKGLLIENSGREASEAAMEVAIAFGCSSTVAYALVYPTNGEEPSADGPRFGMLVHGFHPSKRLAVEDALRVALTARGVKCA